MKNGAEELGNDHVKTHILNKANTDFILTELVY